MKFLLGLFVLGVLSAGAQAAAILQYHHISDSTPLATSTRVELFTQHLEYLAQNDFRVLPLPALIERLQAGEDLAEKTVAITFDDGYDSVYNTALPELKKHQFPFTVFVNADLVGSPGYANWQQLKSMMEAGATVANHTTTHPHMVRKKPGETDAGWRARMTREIQTTQKRIEEELGQIHKLLAYPYGEFNAPLLSLVKSLGYIGLGQYSGGVGTQSNWLALPRFALGSSYGEMDSFVSKASARAMPVHDIKLLSDAGDVLPDPVVAAGDRPKLQFELASPSLAASVNCYWQGGSMPITRKDGVIIVQSPEGLTTGRSRYNCTAPVAGADAFYWFSQPWFITGANGEWQHTD
ncbi:polysaccharide deacetylase family protein [Gilvimarinus xylanilyticus]|uniref:Polysaccharide deacetylase family protein n=1 Tax=Gilvimarinus xylanilyticus TaxID=2944139 RepID=A0A9X2I5K0_9GAMM|nr:polysaccharide deacetylase family protein [Gilvimarinus xylanilyticus]MCP8900755.1 polysaccharide deacetylase family protein [Gilvimarinus xylanilyticus]